MNNPDPCFTKLAQEARAAARMREAVQRMASLAQAYRRGIEDGRKVGHAAGWTAGAKVGAYCGLLVGLALGVAGGMFWITLGRVA